MGTTDRTQTETKPTPPPGACCALQVPAHATNPVTCVCGGDACPVHGHVCHPRWTLD
jgi:hypothetical protein